MSKTAPPSGGAALRPAPTLSVVVPLYRVGAAAHETCQRLRAHLDARATTYELVFVEDGSADGTAEVLEELAARFSVVVAVVLPVNVGQSRAVAVGLAVARGDVIVVLDADLETGVDVIDRLCAAVRAGAELACGRRLNRRQSRLRALGSAVVNAWLRARFGWPLHDFGCGSNAGSRALRDRWLKGSPGLSAIKLGLWSVAAATVEVEIDMRGAPPPVPSARRTASSYGLVPLLRVFFSLLRPRALLAEPRAWPSYRVVVPGGGGAGAPG